jgi:hypothetical protein
VPRDQLSPTLERRYQQDLLDTLKRIDLLEDEKKETRKLLGACIDEEWSRVRVLAALAALEAVDAEVLGG